MAADISLRDIERLERLYEAGLQASYVDTALRKVIARQIDRDELDLADIDAILSEYESIYRMPSAEFFEKFQAGRMEDTADFMTWNASYKSKERILARLAILRGENGTGH